MLQRPRKPLPPHVRPLLAECWPMWELLRRHALRPLSAAVPRGLPAAAAGHPAQGEGSKVGGGGSEAGASQTAAQQVQQAQQAQQAQHGTHAYAADPRNDDILIGIRDGVTGERSLAVCVPCLAGMGGTLQQASII